MAKPVRATPPVSASGLHLTRAEVPFFSSTLIVCGISGTPTFLGGWVQYPQLSVPLQAWMRKLYLAPRSIPVLVYSDGVGGGPTTSMSSGSYPGSCVPSFQNFSPKPVSFLPGPRRSAGPTAR